MSTTVQRSWWKFWGQWSGIVLILVVAYVVFMWWLITLPRPNEANARAMCDKQVSALLTTHDALDLERARYLIRQLNCDIWRRMPAGD